MYPYEQLKLVPSEVSLFNCLQLFSIVFCQGCFHFCTIFYDTADPFSFSLSCLQERKKKEAEENSKNMQQQLQAKAQTLRYEDDLARKRMQVLKSRAPSPTAIYLRY
jgi:hypothetical protein